MDVIVTDHHRPGRRAARVPAACAPGRPSIRSPSCAARASSSSSPRRLHARAGRDPAALEHHLDLVALATIADVVPLRRREPRPRARGPAPAARARRSPGLRALMAVARVDRAHASSPMSASGSRRGSTPPAACAIPTQALELLLTERRVRARALAERLEALNRERQAVEDGILRDGSRPGRGGRRGVARAPGIRPPRSGLARGRDRHRRVAARRALRRPVVLIAGDGDEARDRAGASPRTTSTPASPRLPRAPAPASAATASPRGSRCAPSDVEAFAEALAAHAARSASPTPTCSAAQRIDAVLAPAEASLELADELDRLEPFGLGNPGVTLLAPGGGPARRRADGRRPARAHGRRAGRIPLRRRLVRARQCGRRAPRAAAGSTSPTGSRATSGTARRRCRCSCGRSPPVVDGPEPVPPRERRCAMRRPAAASRTSAAAAFRSPPSPASSRPGSGCCILVADVGRRAGMLRGVLRAGPARLGLRSSSPSTAEAADADRSAASGRRRARPAGRRGRRRAARRARVAACRVHLVWGAGRGRVRATRCSRLRAPLRAALAVVWRADRDGAAPALPAETVERCRTVLREVGLVPPGPVPPPASTSRRRRPTAPRRSRSRTRTPISVGQAGGPAGTPTPLH